MFFFIHRISEITIQFMGSYLHNLLCALILLKGGRAGFINRKHCLNNNNNNILLLLNAYIYV